jgi:hypothetical protein
VNKKILHSVQIINPRDHLSFQKDLAVEFGSPRLALSTPSLDANVVVACAFPHTACVTKTPSSETPFIYEELSLATVS